MNVMRLILASASKQKQDIFKMTGWKYEVVTSKVEEESSKENLNEYVEELSKNKVKLKKSSPANMSAGEKKCSQER